MIAEFCPAGLKALWKEGGGWLQFSDYTRGGAVTSLPIRFQCVELR